MLVARAREIVADLQRGLAADLAADPTTEADPGLLAALVLVGYADVLVGTARRRLAGEPHDALVPEHRARLERLFDALRNGVLPRG